MAASKYFINRFPICAAFYYVVARRLGYTETEAKSLGLARAIFFAAAKAGLIGAKKEPGKKKKIPEPKLKKGETIDQILFAGLPTYIVERPRTIRGLIGEDIIDPKEYDSQVIRKFDFREKGAYDHFIKTVKQFLKKRSDEELNSKLAYTLYTEIRDKYRTTEFYEDISTTASSTTRKT